VNTMAATVGALEQQIVRARPYLERSQAETARTDSAGR
jgi:hypothetical protein